MKQVEFVNDAIEDLSNLQGKVSNRILNKIDSFAAGNSADIKKLTNREEYRLRVGDYRVLFIYIDDKIEIQRIQHRKDVYNF